MDVTPDVDVESQEQAQEPAVEIDADEVISKPQLIGAFEKKYFEDEQEFNRLKEGGFPVTIHEESLHPLE